MLKFEAGGMFGYQSGPNRLDIMYYRLFTRLVGIGAPDRLRHDHVLCVDVFGEATPTFLER